MLKLNDGLLSVRRGEEQAYQPADSDSPFLTMFSFRNTSYHRPASRAIQSAKTDKRDTKDSGRDNGYGTAALEGREMALRKRLIGAVSFEQRYLNAGLEYLNAKDQTSIAMPKFACTDAATRVGVS